MANDIPYKSYCWSIGTTSYRTKNFNRSIERQLQLMYEFRRLPENIGEKWANLQKPYYYYLKEKGFLTGNAGRPEKDAREKVSGLAGIGLLDGGRNVTKPGMMLINTVNSGDFRPDNILELPKDSYIYMKQLLKTSVNVGRNTVRPFIVFLYLESKLKYLTYDEFTYLLPLCIDRQWTERIIDGIREIRNGEASPDDILISVIMGKENYKTAYKEFMENEVSEDLICRVGMNRKSRDYDKPYYPFYALLKKAALEKDGGSVLPLFQSVKKISGKQRVYWTKYLFGTSSMAKIKKEGYSSLKKSEILSAADIYGFKDVFFRKMHLFKVKSTLSDYFDLNRRYFKITGTTIFEDGKVELDILPKIFFRDAAEELIESGFEESAYLTENTGMEKISPCLKEDTRKLYSALGKEYGAEVNCAKQAHEILKREKYVKFNRLIDEKFPKRQIIKLLGKFENRDDEYLRKYITDNADVPTMFEYIIAIAWYVISGREGDVLSYMNLSLEADLLPKTHASGGNADIVYKYNDSKSYPAHSLLIEATLSEKTNQRHMEMEPVSRHLGNFLLEHPGSKAYCVFTATYLDLNVISDFRNRKNMEYFNADGTKSIDGMEIIPLQTSEIKAALEKGVKYAQLFKIFSCAFNSSEKTNCWYKKQIADKIGST